jgi:flagellar biosynthesis protein FlhB
MKGLKVCEAIGDVEDIVVAKNNIRLAKSMYEEVERNTEEELKAYQEVYELRVLSLVKRMNTQLMQVWFMLETYITPTAAKRQGSF